MLVQCGLALPRGRVLLYVVTAVGHLVSVDTSGKALNPSPSITGLTNVFEMVSVFGSMTDTVESRFLGNL